MCGDVKSMHHLNNTPLIGWNYNVTSQAQPKEEGTCVSGVFVKIPNDRCTTGISVATGQTVRPCRATSTLIDRWSLDLLVCSGRGNQSNKG